MHERQIPGRLRRPGVLPLVPVVSFKEIGVTLPVPADGCRVVAALGMLPSGQCLGRFASPNFAQARPARTADEDQVEFKSQAGSTEPAAPHYKTNDTAPSVTANCRLRPKCTGAEFWMARTLFELVSFFFFESAVSVPG